MELKLVLFALDCVPHKQLMYVVFGAMIFLTSSLRRNYRAVYGNGTYYRAR